MLAAGRPAAALEAFLEAWRARRLGALAGLIDRLSEALTRALPPVTGRTRAAYQTAWLDLATQRRPIDVGRLLVGFSNPPWTAVGARIERLATLDDPRVAKAFASFALELPTVGGIGSRWSLVLDTLARLKDSRTRAELEARASNFDSDERILVVEQLAPHAARVVAALPTDAPTPEERDALAQLGALLEQTLAGPLPSAEALLADGLPRRPVANGAEVLELVYQAPEDDGPRLVYADWLEEQGDARAELLRLQLTPSRHPRAEQRAKHLLREHGRRWLGVLEPGIVRRSERFTRGFPSAGRLDFATEALSRQLIGRPEWNTFTELENASADFLERTELRGLERLDTVDDTVLLALTRRTQPLRRLTSLCVYTSLATLPKLLEVPSPVLARLELRSPRREKGHLEVLQSTLRPLVEKLGELWLDLAEPEAARFALGLPRLRRYSTSAGGLPVTFFRQGDGRWALEVFPIPALAGHLGPVRRLLPLAGALVAPDERWGTAREPVFRALDGFRQGLELPWVERSDPAP